MGPSLTDVVRYRYIGAAVLRVAGAMWALFAFVPWGSWWLEGMRDNDITNYGYYSFRILMGAFFLVGGIVLLLLGGPLVRLLMPIPTARCPRCGYALAHLTHPRCPECGLDLSDTSTRPPPSAGDRVIAAPPVRPD
jgi:hypothetical protein